MKSGCGLIVYRNIPIRLSKAGWFRPKSNRGDETKHDEKNQDRKLSKFKRLLGLRWGHRVQRRYFFKRLHDRDEDVEIQSQHGADGIDPAPRSGEMLCITREDSHQEDD